MNGFLVRRVLQKGKLHRSRFFNLLLYKTQSEFFQCAVVCSTKVSKRAVVRNKLRRQLKETLRLYYKDEVLNGYHAVVVIKKDAVGVPYRELLDCFAHVCKNL